MVEKLVIAKSLQEAASLKNARSAFLAGGTEDNRLNSTVDARTLISIGRIAELDGISDEGSSIRIGAMSTFQDIIDSPVVPEYLKEACRFMGSRTKRNMATIGGNIALRRTDSYLYPTLLACCAKLVLMDAKGDRIQKCVCCFNRKHDELKDLLIVEIRVPKDARVVSKRVSNTVQSHAVLTVALGEVEGKLRLGVAAKDTALTRLDAISDALEKGPLSDEAILKMVKSDEVLKFKSDIFGSPEYKSYRLAVTVADLYRTLKGGAR